MLNLPVLFTGLLSLAFSHMVCCSVYVKLMDKVSLSEGTVHRKHWTMKSRMYDYFLFFVLIVLTIIIGTIAFVDWDSANTFRDELVMGLYRTFKAHGIFGFWFGITIFVGMYLYMDMEWNNEKIIWSVAGSASAAIVACGMFLFTVFSS